MVGRFDLLNRDAFQRQRYELTPNPNVSERPEMFRNVSHENYKRDRINKTIF